jgi:hypothetical protein
MSSMQKNINLFAISSHATGFIRIDCQTQNSRLILNHFGFRHTVVMRELIYGPGSPHLTSVQPIFDGSGMSIGDNGVGFYVMDFLQTANFRI